MCDGIFPGLFQQTRHVLQVRRAVPLHSHCINTPVVGDVRTKSSSSALTRVLGPVSHVAERPATLIHLFQMDDNLTKSIVRWMSATWLTGPKTLVRVEEDFVHTSPTTGWLHSSTHHPSTHPRWIECSLMDHPSIHVAGRLHSSTHHPFIWGKGKGRTLSCCIPLRAVVCHQEYLGIALFWHLPLLLEHHVLLRPDLEQGTLHLSAQYSRDWATATPLFNLVSHWHSSKVKHPHELCCLSSVLHVAWVALMLLLWTFFSRGFLDRVGGPLSVLWCHLPKLEPCSLPGVFLYSQVCWLAKLVYSMMVKV